LAYKMIKNWEREPKEPLREKISGMIGHRTPLKEKIAMCLYRLKTQKTKIAESSARMQQRDRDYFNKCVAAQMAKDSARAAMYANECAEVRKMAKTTLRCELALEQITLRLETVEEFGDLAVTMGPVVGVVQAIKSQIQGIMPQVSYELGMIGETLNGMVVEVGEATGAGYDISTSGEEAQRIITEANTIAEQRMKERFPELPTAAPAVPTAPSEQTGIPR